MVQKMINIRDTEDCEILNRYTMSSSIRLRRKRQRTSKNSSIGVSELLTELSSLDYCDRSDYQMRVQGSQSITLKY